MVTPIVNLTFFRVSVRPIDRKSAAVLRNNRTRRARAVAPIDRRREIACRCIRIGIGEGRNRRTADRCPFGAAHCRAGGRERCVRYSCRAAGRNLRSISSAVTVTVMLYWPLVRIRVAAVDYKAAPFCRAHRAAGRRAITPIDGGRKSARCFAFGLASVKVAIVVSRHRCAFDAE